MNGINDAWPLEHQIVAAMRQLVRAVDLHSRRLVENYGLTGPQLATLQEVARLGPVLPSAIARSVHLSQGTVTGILHRLERRGLVARRRSETDRRNVIVEVTAEGKRLLDTAPSLLQDHFRHELERLEEWERLQILSTLQRVASLMGAERIDTSPHLSSTDDLASGGAASSVFEESEPGSSGSD
jgi:DNA-binding MarR family transcriptional regulator